jgi:hypothetical protein
LRATNQARKGGIADILPREERRLPPQWQSKKAHKQNSAKAMRQRDILERRNIHLFFELGFAQNVLQQDR